MYAGCYINKQLAIQMIQLMLNAAGQQPGSRQMLDLATAVQKFHLHFLGRLLINCFEILFTKKNITNHNKNVTVIFVFCENTYS